MGKTIAVECPFGTFEGYDNDDVIKQIQEFGMHTRPELSMILDFIKPGDVVVDVGAHIGTFVVPIKQAVGEQGKVYAFEAHPDTFGLLEKNVQLNQMSAHLYNQGVSNQEGVLYIADRKNKHKNTAGNYLVEAESDFKKIDDLQVQLVRIDDTLSEPIDFLKVDVEGRELDVLRSAAQTIDKYRPIVYSEFVEFFIKRRGGDNPQEYEDFFKTRKYHFFLNCGDRNASHDDYNLVKVPGIQYVRKQVDFLLIPEESARYPKQYQEWYQYDFFGFAFNRFRNMLKQIKGLFSKS